MDASKYTGVDYGMRLALSASCIMGLTAVLAYPLDLINTRLASDMSKTGQPRLFKTTFDCFNRTNIDEGRAGLYKGLELSVASSAARAVLALPLYDAVQKQSQALSLNQYGFDKIGVSMLTSLIMSVFLYPLDTAKRCMQLNGARGHFSHYKGSLDCLRQVALTGGASMWYRGVHIYAIKEFMVAMAQLTLYNNMFGGAVKQEE